MALGTTSCSGGSLTLLLESALERCVIRPATCLFFTLVAALSVILLAGCDERATFTPPPPPGVTVSVPLAKTVQESADFTGQTSASLSVDLVARVPGFLRDVKFTDG